MGEGEGQKKLGGNLLESAAVGEGEGPGALALDRVHDRQVDRRLLLRHATGEEGDARHSRGHGALQGLDRRLGDILHKHDKTHQKTSISACAQLVYIPFGHLGDLSNLPISAMHPQIHAERA